MSETMQQPENGLSNDCRRKQTLKLGQSVVYNNSKGQHFGYCPNNSCHVIEILCVIHGFPFSDNLCVLQNASFFIPFRAYSLGGIDLTMQVTSRES